MAIELGESTNSLGDDRLQVIFHELHERLGITVDFNSYEPYGLQFWSKLESDLIKPLEISSIEDIEQGRNKLSLFLDQLIKELQIQITSSDLSSILDQFVAHYFGLGVLEILLGDNSISEILINSFQEVYFKKKGKLQRASTSFWSDAHFKHVINRLCCMNNVKLPSDENPITTFSLPDNSSVIILFPPATINSPSLVINRYAKGTITIDQLIQFGSISKEMMRFLKIAIEARFNILMCGYMQSGISTFVNVLSSFIPGDERVISIEHENGFSLRINHLIKLIAGGEQIGGLSYEKLLALSGRMGADRLVLGEFLSSDAYNVLNVINDYFSGSILKITAKSPYDAVNRLETLIQLDKPTLSIKKIRNLIRSSIDLIVYQERIKDGSRVVKNIVEVLDEIDSKDQVALREIFGIEQTGFKDGRILRKVISSGKPSEKLMDKIEAAGIELPSDLFTISESTKKEKGLSEIERRAIKFSKGNYVFISYSRNDEIKVRALVKELENNGFYVWLDVFDIVPGEDWTKNLEKAIKNAGAFIVILTPSSVDSQPVRSEIIMAQDEKLPIIPVMMENCDSPIQIRTLQYILYDEQDMIDTVNRISENLSTYITNKQLVGEI